MNQPHESLRAQDDMTPASSAAQAAQSDYDQVVARLQMRAHDGHTDEQRHRVRAATQC